jgi:hypothetical protein
MELDEQLARRFMLYLDNGDPEAMRQMMSPSFPGREEFIRGIATKVRRNPVLMAKLSGPEILEFFQEEPGGDAFQAALQRQRFQHEQDRLVVQLAQGALLLGQAEQKKREGRGGADGQE